MISQSKIVTEKLKNYLKRHPEIEKKLLKNKKQIFFTTESSERIKKLAKETSERIKKLAKLFYGQLIELSLINFP